MGKRRAASEEVAREQELEALLFGKDDAPQPPRDDDDQPVHIQEGVDFMIDVGPQTASSSTNTIKAKPDVLRAGRAAWEDEDDTAITVNIASVNRLKKLRKDELEDEITGTEYSGRLRKQFERSSKNISWAELQGPRTDGEDDDLDEDISEIVRSSNGVLSKTQAALPRGTLSISRLKDANVQEPAQGVVQSIEFHPAAPLLLTASFDKTLRLFQIDGVKNPKLQAIHLSDLPISKARFTLEGKRIICAGKRRYLYVVDIDSGRVSRINSFRGMESGRLDVLDVSQDGASIAIGGEDGSLVLLDQKNMRQRCTLKAPHGSINALAFSADSGSLYALAGNNTVSVWDVRSGKCLHTKIDEGAVQSTALSICPEYLATGSSSGVVNVYSPLGQESKPKSAGVLKDFMNLTTPIDQLKFNSSRELLAFSSRQAQDSVRLVHLGSRTVFSNWPTKQTPLSHVSTVAFSPNSGFFGVGNDKGRVLLFRLNAYNQY